MDLAILSNKAIRSQAKSLFSYLLFFKRKRPKKELIPNPTLLNNDVIKILSTY